ncbi:MAG: lytic transglycosylase domain-containing protein [Desulfoarculaceae bacterium]|nr:lytic transglycosylase domain-containing protein [Desulfoarculaceae bacterium]
MPRTMKSCILLLCACAILLLPASGHSQLANSINKYKDVRLSTERMNKIGHYHELIDYFAGFTFFQARHKVNADFIRALILAESDADTGAVSSKNARGLGQIIPSTGIEAGIELSRGTVDFHNVSRERLRNLSEEDLFDPAVNILLTCYLIAKYNYKFNGQLHLVLSAWNAGENIKELKYGQHAPYQETIDLIGKVNGYYLCLLKQKKTRLADNGG